MENNYNEWNPNGTTESAQDSMDKAENTNTAGNAETAENTDAVVNTEAAENTDAAVNADTAVNMDTKAGTDAVNTDTAANAETASNQGAAYNPYQQYQNPNQQYQGSQNYGNTNSTYGTQNSGYGTQNSGYGTQNSGYGTQGSAYGPIHYNQQGSPYSQQYRTQSSAYGAGAQQAQGSAYSAGAQQAQGSAYGAGSQQAQGGAYGAGAQQAQSSAYGAGSQQAQGGAYGAGGQAQGAAYGMPYQNQANGASGKTTRTKVKKEKKSGGMASLLGKAVAVALVFGLVAGLVFSGVSYGISSALGTETSSESENSSSGKTVSTVSTSGEASDLVDVSSIVDAVMPGIVAITNVSTVTTNSMFGTYSYESQSLGSGIIIDQDSEYLYICTNNHVVSGAETLTVQFVDDSTVSAEITGTDEADDLAVIQVALSSIESDTLEAITICEVDDSGDLSVGEATIAIGNSLGYGQSVTTGVISALGRTISVSDETTGETTVCTNLIQTDAAINSGNSGGALLNSSGAVIGINSAKYSDTGVEGMGYAIPMSDAWSIIQAIIAGEDIPQSAYLGISGQSVSSDVSSVYGVPEGVLVVEVIEGTAAEAAGIQSGDIITKFEGEELTSMSELQTALAAYKEGDTVTITIARKSAGYEETDLEVTLGASSSSN